MLSRFFVKEDSARTSAGAAAAAPAATDVQADDPVTCRFPNWRMALPLLDENKVGSSIN